MEGYIEQLRAIGARNTFRDEWELADAVEPVKQSILGLKKVITPADSAKLAAIFADPRMHSEVRSAAVSILLTTQQPVPAAVAPAVECVILNPQVPLSLSASATKYVALCAAAAASASSEVAACLTQAFSSAAISALQSDDAKLRLAILGRDITHNAGADAFGGVVLSGLEELLPRGLLARSEDPAIVLNALELFEDAACWPSYTPLMDGFLGACVCAIGDLLAKSANDALWGALLAPAALRGLGSVVRMAPAKLVGVAERSGLLKRVAEMFNEWCVDSTTRNDMAAGCVECVGRLGSSAAGMEALERAAPGILASLGRVAVAGSVQSTQLMAAHVLGDMLIMASDRAAMSRGCEALIFRKLTPSPRAAMSALRKAAEQPIEDTSCAALHLVQGLAHHEWGLRAIAAQGGMLEGLSDPAAVPPGMEPRAASALREWRHATVRSIVMSLPKEKVIEIVGSAMYTKLRGFVMLGPQYIQPATAASVAVGDSSR